MSTVNKITVTKNSSSNTYGLKDIDALRSAALTNVENEYVATKAYAVNDFLYRDDIFYKVIAPIPRGGTFVINQNIKATKLTNELAILNPTVIANPTGEVTGELEKLQVGNIVYGVSGGGSATLEGLEDTVIEEPTTAQPLTYDEENEVQINGGVIPIENGGTGNTTGYIKTGQKEGSTIGDNATIEGIDNVASGTAAHAEGQGTSAIGSKSHTEGANTKANNVEAHAEGTQTTAEGQGSHAEGGYTYAKGLYSHSEGNDTTAFGQYTHAEGRGSYAIADQSHAEGYFTSSQGYYSHSEGMNTSAVGSKSHAEGNQSTALGDQSHSEGYKTYAVKDYSHAEGSQTCAPGLSAHSENYYTKAIGDYSHAEGNYTIANGDSSHAEGYNTYANSCAHAEGSGKAYGSYSHAEGSQTTTSKQASHAEGSVTYAIGEASHAEGYCTTAEGDYSHSQGNYTTAKGNRSSAAGKNTIAGYNDQFVLGYYNDNKEGNLFEIGNGTYETKSNALEVDAEGNLLVSGSITDGDGNVLGPGGTTVIANPAEASTDTLTKLQVGNAVYGISGGGGASTLAALTDTTITSPTAAQPLTYDATNSKWINGGIIPVANGGTGNTTGYVQAGRKANTNIGVGATAEGANTTASGNQSHAEGYNTQATGRMAHVEGENTKATNGASHAEGADTTASGNSSHAQGNNTIASGHYSSAAGRFTVAGYNDQFVIGKYNNNKSTSILEVGIGTGSGATPKINGLELDTSGNLKVAGTITDGNGNVLNQHFDQTVTLSTSAQTTATFTNAVFTTDTCVDIALTEQGLVPDDVVVTTGSCTVTLPIVDTAHDVTVRVYVR